MERIWSWPGGGHGTRDNPEYDESLEAVLFGLEISMSDMHSTAIPAFDKGEVGRQ